MVSASAFSILCADEVALHGKASAAAAVPDWGEYADSRLGGGASSRLLWDRRSLPAVPHCLLGAKIQEAPAGGAGGHGGAVNKVSIY